MSNRQAGCKMKMSAKYENGKWIVEVDGVLWLFTEQNVKLFLFEVRNSNDQEVEELLEALSFACVAVSERQVA